MNIVHRTGRVSTAVLFVIMLTPIVYASAATNNSAISNCTSASLERQMLDAGNPVSQTTARSFAESSAVYYSLANGSSSTFTGTGNEWNLNFANCTVSWSGIIVNYLLTSTIGSRSILGLYENPINAVIYSYQLTPWFSATIATNASETYSGYGLAVAAHPSGVEVDEVNYTGTYWLQPTVSNDASPGCGSSGSSICSLGIWTGLQNSTYDGPDHTVAHGETLQTGTLSTVVCSPSCVTTYSPFSEFVSGTTSGVYQNAIQTCPGVTISSGDDIVASVGSQAVVNGTSGKAFYTFDEDDTTAKACDFAWNPAIVNCTTTGHSAEACKIEGHEYYADYFAERTQAASGYNQLPDFTSFYFYRTEMLNSSTGSYPYYNDGYGIGSAMSNSGSVNTSTGSMSETGGSIHYGYFTETWESSVNT